MRLPVLFLLFAVSITINTYAGKKLKVLFIGNSYTYSHNIPTIVAEIAKSMGDTLVHDMSASGGQNFSGHLIDALTQSKIKAGGWDYIVLQEQSQIPSFPEAQIQTGFLPSARKLDSIAKVHNPCGQTMFYMTWGRQNGDDLNCPVYPPVCTYIGMDSLLRLRYMRVADSNDAEVSPVGAVWRYIRNNYPAVQLYEADQSHQSQSGAYAAACAFYTALFRKDPLNISYNHTLSAIDAVNIRIAAKKVVFDSMTYWHIGEYDVIPAFAFAISGNTVTFTNKSVNALSYTWDFGDGQTSTQASPSHIYSAPGIYEVRLTAYDKNNCEARFDTTVNFFPANIACTNAGTTILVYPNPAAGVLNVRLPALMQQYQVEVINPHGQVMYRAENSQDRIGIDISGLPSGIYMVRISHDGFVLHHHFMKQ